MKMPDEWLGERTQLNFVDPYRQRTAPIVLWGCMGSLAGGEAPEFKLVESQETRRETAWRILWVTASRIVFVDAVNQVEDWDAFDTRPAAGTVEQLDAWVCPRDAIARISLRTASAKNVRDYSSDRDKTWHWEATYQLTLRDGKEVGLPLFEEFRTNAHEASVTELVRGLAL